MASTTVERPVSAAPDVVWAIISDLDRSARVISAIEAIDRLDGTTGFGVGTRWSETRRMLGRESSDVLEVTSIDEGRSYTVEGVGTGVRYTTVMSCEPRADGSLLSMAFAGTATSVAAKIGAFLGRFFSGRLEAC